MSTQFIRTVILGAFVAAGLAACGQSNNQQSENTTTEQGAPAAPTHAACDTTCLTGDFDKLLEAMVAHDPSKAPLADKVKYTENAQVVEVGDGIWGVASDLPTNYKLVIPDPTIGQVAFHVVMKESGNPVWFAGRMKVENQKITEIEAVVVRQGSGFGAFDRALDPVWAEVVPQDQRSTREVMIDDANKYFDALQDNKANYAPFADDCGRVENGVVTANNPDAKARPGAPNIGAMSCTGNINSMMWRYITKIDQRHLAAIDEEHGIVSMFVMFNQAGNVDSTEIPGYGTYKYTGAAHRPFNALILESFKIVNGKIRQIAATLSTMPYGTKDKWSD
jgi:hypothetical protein